MVKFLNTCANLQAQEFIAHSEKSLDVIALEMRSSLHRKVNTACTIHVIAYSDLVKGNNSCVNVSIPTKLIENRLYGNYYFNQE